MSLNLSGKVAVVTGSTKGIGLAILKQLAEAGASVVVSARTGDEVAQVVSRLGAAGHRAAGRPCDVSDPEAVEALAAHAEQTFGGIDIWVNNAGIGIFKSVAEMTPEEWMTLIGTNLTGAFLGSHAAIPRLQSRGGGYIFNISSLAGRYAHPNMAAYNASKFGLNGFSEALMQEVRPMGIKVSCIMPGSVSTEFNGKTPDETASHTLQPEDVAQIVIDLLAMPPRALPSLVELRPARPGK